MERFYRILEGEVEFRRTGGKGGMHSAYTSFVVLCLAQVKMPKRPNKKAMDNAGDPLWAAEHQPSDEDDEEDKRPAAYKVCRDGVIPRRGTCNR